MTASSVRPEAPLRAVIYTRVSVDKSQEARSPKQQEAESRKDIARNGWTLDRVYTDNDRSASRYAKRARPGFDELFLDIVAHRFDVVVVWEASRLSRDVAVFAELMTACRVAGVRLCINGRVSDLSNPEDEFVLNLESALAQRESGVTRKRIMRDIASSAEAGRPHGKRQFGYQRVYDDRTGRLIGQEPHPTEGPIVREMFDRVARGESLASVARWMTATRVPRRHGGTSWGGGVGVAAWTPARVGQTLRSPAYLGHRTLRGVVAHEDAWPALVDAFTFRRVQALLNDPIRRTTKAQGIIVHVLSGLIVCDGCAGRVYWKNTCKSRPAPTYRCRRGCITRPAEPIEDAITKLVIGRLSDAKVLRELATGNDHELASILKELDDLTQRVTDAVDAAAEGALTPRAAGVIEKRLAPRIDELTRRADELRVPVDADVVALAGHDAARRWAKASIEQRRNVIRALVELRLIRLRPGLSLGVRYRLVNSTLDVDL